MALYPQAQRVGLEQLTIARRAVLRGKWIDELTQAEKARLEDMAAELREMHERRVILQRITQDGGA